MLYKFGLDGYSLTQKKERVPVVWDSESVINGHMLIIGKSGAGKTFRLRKLIDDGVATGGARFHIMDVHGDIEIDGCSSVRFSEATQYGINPLKINSDKNYGGIRKRVQSFLSTLNRTQSRALGPKQEAVLRNIIIDLYAANGFYADKPESWVLNDGVQRKFPKKYPNIEDAYRFAFAKLRQLFLGTGAEATKHLDEINRKTSSLQRKIKQMGGVKTDETNKLADEIKKLSDQATEAFSKYLSSIETGQEIDNLLKYDSMDVLKSVVDRLENMMATGLFKNQNPPFDPGNKVWRYDISALGTSEKSEQRMFVEFYLQEIFARAIQRGPVSEIMDVIIIDEAHLFFRDDDENILNTIAKEARKFGIGLICASQSPTHFSDDFLANVGTKIILGIDQMYWEGSARKMKIDPKLFNYIVPHKIMAVQINNKGANNSASSFRQVYVGSQ